MANNSRNTQQDVNSLILMLGMLNGKLDEIITILAKMERQEKKRVFPIPHISKKGNTQK